MSNGDDDPADASEEADAADDAEEEANVADDASEEPGAADNAGEAADTSEEADAADDASEEVDAAGDTEEEADTTDDAEGADTDEPAGATAAPTLPDEATEESLNEYLDEIANRLDGAETEADLDDVDALLDDAEEGVAEADLPEPDEDDEDADDPRGDLEDRIAELRDGVEEARGPYGEDVVDAIEAAASTLEETEWTAEGRDDAVEAVDAFLEETFELVGVDASPESEDLDDRVEALDAVAEGVEEADLDPDDDAETIAALLDATDELEAGLEDAEEWDDLETHEQLRAQGYYDVLGHYKDFPVEWAALKEHEARGNVDMILLALGSLQSDFMERHCLEAFERMGKRGKTEASVEELLGRAEKRDRPSIRILGKMAAEEATETLVEYVSEDSNPQLQKTVFKALGEIGAADAVQPLANQLDPEGDTEDLVRPHAARALGLIGDTRAIDPLTDALDEDDSDDVRAAAGWALRQIGTREALEAVAEYGDEQSFIVSTEAEKADRALDDAAPTA